MLKQYVALSCRDNPAGGRQQDVFLLHRSLPRDSSNPLKRVAILPLKNDTNDVDGPEVMRKKMVQALERRSYVVKDLKETDQILRDRMGITLGGQLDLTTAQKLGRGAGC